MKLIKRIAIYAAVLVTGALMTVSCRRLPIHEPFSSYYLVLEGDYKGLHINPTVPGMYEAVFYDIYTHEEVGQSYLGTEGGYIYGLRPGKTYEMIVYSFDSGNTQVSDLRSFPTALASTGGSSSTYMSSYNAPDHLMVARDTALTLPFLYDSFETEYLYAYPKSVCDTWCIIVTGIKGLQYATSMEFFVSGQSKSNNIGPNEPSTREMTINFPAKLDMVNNRIYTPFCTFGKIPGKVSELRLVITDGNEKTIVCKADVTGQFDDPENTGHWIILDFSGTEIEEKKDGGFTPVVDPWGGNEFFYDLS